jgi:protein-tyrosine-phosphatase
VLRAVLLHGLKPSHGGLDLQRPVPLHWQSGSFPRGRVHPLAVELLEKLNLRTAGLRSKSWNEFAAPGAPAMDFVFTVCDQAAAEPCPYWPGQPMTAHWGLPDPAAVQGGDADMRHAFRDTLMALRRRIEVFASLPLEKLDRIAIQKHITDIGSK